MIPKEELKTQKVLHLLRKFETNRNCVKSSFDIFARYETENATSSS